MPAFVNRSTITFIVNETVGVLIVLHELILREGERPFFLALAGTLMGLPFVLAADGRITRRDTNSDKEADLADRWSGLP